MSAFIRTIKRFYGNIVYIERYNLYEERIRREVSPTYISGYKYNRILDTLPL